MLVTVVSIAVVAYAQRAGSAPTRSPADSLIDRREDATGRVTPH